MAKQKAKNSQIPQAAKSNHKNDKTQKKSNMFKKSKRSNDNKIHYVMNPKLIQNAQKAIQQKMQKQKDKEIQSKSEFALSQHRFLRIFIFSFSQILENKRNQAFISRTSKGQPKLNLQMQMIYNQIERKYGKSAGGSTSWWSLNVQI